MTLESSNDTVAILYDIENSPFEMLNFTLEKAERYQPCRIIVVSDWDARPEQKRWEKLMRRPGFTFRQISRTFFGKNSLDSALYDSAQILYQEGVRKFFIVTTDTDFVSIAQSLNVDTPSYIIGVGTKQASESLRSAYNEFFVYPPEEDVKKSKNAEAPEPAQEKAKGSKAQEKTAKAKAAKEQPAKEKPVKEKAAKEKAAKEKTAKEKAAKAPKNLSKQYLSYMVKQLFSKESKNLSHPSAYMQATATSYRATARDSFLLNRLASMAEMTASVESSLIQPKNLLSSDLDVRFDLVSCETGEPINPEVDVFTNCYVRVTNRTEEPLYVNVLDIDERGNKYLVLPVDEAATCAHLLVPAGCTVAFKSEPFEFSEANSRETFLLVATEEPVDFSILMSPIRGNGGDQMKSGIYRVSYLTK